MSVLRRLMALLRGRVAPLVAGLIFTPFVVRVLSPTAYGDYMYFLTLLGTIKFFTLLGGPEVVRQQLGEHSNQESQGRIIGFFLSIALVSGIIAVTIILLVAVTGIYTRVYPERYGQYLLIFAGMILAVQTYAVARNSLMGLGYEPASEWLPVIRAYVQYPMALLAGILALGGAGAIFGTVMALATATVVGSLLLFRRFPFNKIAVRPTSFLSVSEMLRAFVNTGLVMFAMTAIQSADIILVGALGTSEDVAYYRNALMAATFIMIIPSVISRFFVHDLAADWANNNLERIQRVLNQGTRLGIVIAALPAIGLWVMADQFVVLYYGAAYDPAIIPLRILLPGVLLFTVAQILIGAGLAQSRRRLLILSTWSAAIINVIGNVLLIPRIGITGAAVASALSYGVLTISVAGTLWRLGAINRPDWGVVRVVVTLVVGGAAIYVIHWVVQLAPVPSIATFAVTPPAGAAVYSTVAIATRSVRMSEIETVLPETIQNRIRLL